MADHIVLTGTLTTSAANVSPLPAYVATTGYGGLSVTVAGDPVAIAARAATSKVLGWRVEIDNGAGSWIVVPPAEVVVANIRRSIREGATCELEFTDTKYSPLISGWVRGLTPARVTMIEGARVTPLERVMFLGYSADVVYDRVRKTLRMTCVDESSKAANKIIAPRIDAENPKARDAYLSEVLAANDVPVGQIELGPNGSTMIRKPFSLFDQPLLSWVRDYLAPCGAAVWFDRAGRLNAARYTPSQPVARDLWPKDAVVDLTLAPPSSMGVNTVTAITIDYERTTPDGFRTVSRVERVYALGLIEYAVLRKNPNGTTDAIDTSGQTPSYRQVGETRTLQTFLGELPIRTEVWQFAEYSPRRAVSQLATDGTTVENLNVTAYQYADGSWRAHAWKRMMLVSGTIAEKKLYGIYVTETVESEFRWRWRERALWLVAGGADTFNGASAIPITETGAGLVNSTEYFGSQPDPSWIGVFGISAPQVPDESLRALISMTTGVMHGVDETARGWQRGTAYRSGVNGTYGYGLTNPTHHTQERETIGDLFTRRVRYEVESEEQYSIIETVTNRGAWLTGGDDIRTSVRYGYGAPPRTDQLMDLITSQEFRHTAEDSVRVALAGEIGDYIDSEYAQDGTDLQILAESAVRDLSAWGLPVVVPIEAMITEGQHVRLWGYPEDGIHGLRCVVEAVDLDPRSYTARLDCVYYPPEVA